MQKSSCSQLLKTEIEKKKNKTGINLTPQNISLKLPNNSRKKILFFKTSLTPNVIKLRI